MMTKYRKKPVIVEAWLWDGKPETIYQIGRSHLGRHEVHKGLLYGSTLIDSSKSPVKDWELKWHQKDINNIIDAFDYQIDLIINTLEGKMTANEGDYIIKGVQGEYYPCKPDIFKETYEAVEDEETHHIKQLCECLA